MANIIVHRHSQELVSSTSDVFLLSKSRPRITSLYTSQLHISSVPSSPISGFQFFRLALDHHRQFSQDGSRNAISMNQGSKYGNDPDLCSHRHFKIGRNPSYWSSICFSARATNVQCERDTCDIPDLSDIARVVLFRVSVFLLVPMCDLESLSLQSVSFLFLCHESDILESDRRLQNLTSDSLISPKRKRSSESHRLNRIKFRHLITSRTFSISPSVGIPRQ